MSVELSLQQFSKYSLKYPMKNDKEITAYSRLLWDEATTILITEGLLEILQGYGPARVIGSYTLDTMTWPDIDISMNLQKEQDVTLFLEIGTKIANKFTITKMSYSNHYIRNFPGYDHGLYWGIQTQYANRDWKIDLWGYSETEYNKHMSGFDELHDQIKYADRAAILRIKHSVSQRPDYRGDVYNSMAIYRAVMTDKIQTIEEFNTWIERNSHANI